MGNLLVGVDDLTMTPATVTANIVAWWGSLSGGGHGMRGNLVVGVDSLTVIPAVVTGHGSILTERLQREKEIK